MYILRLLINESSLLVSNKATPDPHHNNENFHHIAFVRPMYPLRLCTAVTVVFRACYRGLSHR